MVIMIEAIFSDWQHEECNNGMIDLIESYFPDEDIKLYATSGHIQTMKHIGINSRIETKEIVLPKDAFDDEIGNIKIYLKLLNKIYIENHLRKTDKVIFLSCNKSVMLSALLVDVLHHRVPLYFICHGFLDWLLDGTENLEKKYNIRNVMNLVGQFDFVKWAAFNPFVRKELKGKLNDRTLRKIYFLHHPMLGLGKDRCGSESVNIGVYGACIKASASFLIEALNREIPDKNYTFKILQRIDRLTIGFPKTHTDIKKVHTGFSREERLNELAQMDWILLPYTKDQYRVSMSGILADAIRNDIPIIAYSSPIIEWYGRWKIGIIGENLEDLAGKISKMLEHPQENQKRYAANIRRMKKRIETHNQKLLDQLFMNGRKSL